MANRPAAYLQSRLKIGASKVNSFLRPWIAMAEPCRSDRGRSNLNLGDGGRRDGLCVSESSWAHCERKKAISMPNIRANRRR